MSGAALAASADMMPVQVVTAAAAVPEPTLSTFYLAYSEEVFKNSVKVILARPAPWAIIPRTHTLCRDPVLAIQAAELHAIESPAKKPKVQGPATRSIYILRLRLHDDDVEPVEEANAFGSKLARSLELSDFEPAHVAETSAELCAATLAEETLYPKPAWRPLADLARDLRQAVIEAKRQSLQQQLREARDVEDKARKEVAKLVRELETLWAVVWDIRRPLNLMKETWNPKMFWRTMSNVMERPWTLSLKRQNPRQADPLFLSCH